MVAVGAMMMVAPRCKTCGQGCKGLWGCGEGC